MNSSRSSMAKHAKKLALKVADLENKIELITHQYDQLLQSYDSLQYQFKQFQRHRFGQRSEAFIDPANPQGSLFDDWPTTASSDEDDDNNGVKVNGYERKKKRNKGFADHLPRKEFHIKVADEDRVCGCGCQKQPLPPARHERLHYEPPIFEVWVELRERLMCPNGCQGQWVVAQKPKRVLPKVSFTESLLAHIIVSKLDDRQPYYHLEKQFESRAGFILSRQTMARSVINCSRSFQPMVNLFKDEIISYSIGSLDPTTLQVLRESGRPPTRKSYLYCFTGGEPGKEVSLFEYNASDHKPFVANWFAGFEGTIHCDGDPFFELLFESDAISPSYCNSHARRKFEPLAKAVKADGLAKTAMRYFNRVFWVERMATKQKMTADERHDYRQLKTAPIMADFNQWLDDHYPLVLPKSPLGKAMEYCLKYWTGLNKFLSDGRLRPDNNLTEQQIKYFVMIRKNFLFCTSVEGAKALALHFSILRTAKLHHLDPYRYYVALLNALPHCQRVDDYEALLPWIIDLPKVGEIRLAA